MSVATPLTPRSALRHRPLTSSQAKVAPSVRRASRSGATTRPLSPERNVAREPMPHQMSHQQRFHGRLAWGGGMLLALSAILFGQLLLNWMTTISNDWLYGQPRTFQIDAVVGHSDSQAHPSHFIALNMRGDIVVIELPAGDPARARIFHGPHLAGPGAELVPVTLQFSDPARTGHPDMLLLFSGTEMVFRNMHETFQPGS